jgi:hypothetical protein
MPPAAAAAAACTLLMPAASVASTAGGAGQPRGRLGVAVHYYQSAGKAGGQVVLVVRGDLCTGA